MKELKNTIMPSEISSPGHYPELYKKYLIEKKSRRFSYKNKNYCVCRTGEVFLDGKLLSRSWDGDRKDYIVHMPLEDKKIESIYFKVLFKNAYDKRN